MADWVLKKIKYLSIIDVIHEADIYFALQASDQADEQTAGDHSCHGPCHHSVQSIQLQDQRLLMAALVSSTTASVGPVILPPLCQ